jgi:microfibrillar-associated protein 1
LHSCIISPYLFARPQAIWFFAFFWLPDRFSSTLDEAPIAPVFIQAKTEQNRPAPSASSSAALAASGPDRRLARLQELPRERGHRRYHDAEVIDAEPVVVEATHRRRRAEAEVIEEPAPAPTPAASAREAPDDEDHEARRARIKAQRQAEEAAADAASKKSKRVSEEESGDDGSDEDDSSDEDDEDDSSEEDSSSDSDVGRPMVRPTFVRKEDRRTVLEKEQAAKEEEEQRLEEEKRLDEKRKQTRELVQEQIQAELLPAGEDDSDEDLETDEENEEQTEAEYNAWKIRELKRLRRDRAERFAEEEERRDIERRRNMTDAEIMAENRADPSKQKQRRKMQFMQKYYHAGAFFQDDVKELKETHDFSAPTGEDSYFDKSSAPQVLQVRNFGRGSRSKYTHLADQDTTKKSDNPWNASKEVFNKMKTKLGGMKEQSFDRPSKKRKLE